MYNVYINAYIIYVHICNVYIIEKCIMYKFIKIYQANL